MTLGLHGSLEVHLYVNEGELSLIAVRNRNSTRVHSIGDELVVVWDGSRAKRLGL